MKPIFPTLLTNHAPSFQTLNLCPSGPPCRNRSGIGQQQLDMFKENIAGGSLGKYVVHLAATLQTPRPSLEFHHRPELVILGKSYLPEFAGKASTHPAIKVASSKEFFQPPRLSTDTVHPPYESTLTPVAGFLAHFTYRFLLHHLSLMT